MKRTRLKQVSAKRRAEAPLRAKVRELTIERAKGRCEAAHLVPIPCRGELEVHERHQRSIRPGSHLDLDDTMAICADHHRWIDANIAEAHRLGLLRHSWEA